MSESVLQEANRLINFERHSDHGDADLTFTAIAELFHTYFSTKHPDAVIPRIDSTDISILYAFTKIIRFVGGNPKRDHVVDACGYLGLIEKVGVLDK